jgi:hypothetical protein
VEANMGNSEIENSDNSGNKIISGPLGDFFDKISKKSFDIFKYGMLLRFSNYFIYMWVGGINHNAHGKNQFIFLSTEPTALAKVSVFRFMKYSINIFYVF